MKEREERRKKKFDTLEDVNSFFASFAVQSIYQGILDGVLCKREALCSISCTSWGSFLGRDFTEFAFGKCLEHFATTKKKREAKKRIVYVRIGDG